MRFLYAMHTLYLRFIYHIYALSLRFIDVEVGVILDLQVTQPRGVSTLSRDVNRGNLSSIS